MEFKLVQQIVKNIQDTITNTAIGSSRSLMSHTFSTKVKNFPKVQKVNGIVSVSNQKRVEKELKTNGITLKIILKWMRAFKLPTEIRVSNFPKFPKFPEFPKSFKVSNFPKFPEPIKNIRVSNQPTKEIKDLAKLLKQLEKAVKGLKLDPSITVQAPEPRDVIVPPSNVSVTQQEIDYEKLASLIPVAETLDIKKLSEAIAKEIAESIVSIGGGGSSGGGKSFMTSDGKPARGYLDSENRLLVSGSSVLDRYKASEIDTDSDVNNWYYGFTDIDGAWYIMREAKATGSYRYAVGSEDYPTAWTARASQTYIYYYEAF